MIDAKPGEIYVDKEGKRWRVYGICREPMLFVEEDEPSPPNPVVRKMGGVSGIMWEGFKLAQ